MAGSRHLRLIAGIVLAVLLGHWAALAWLQSVRQDTLLLKPLATPMYTRLLTPASAPTSPVAQQQPAPARAKRTLSAVAPRTAGKPLPDPAPAKTPKLPVSDAEPPGLPAPESTAASTTTTATPTTATSTATSAEPSAAQPDLTTDTAAARQATTPATTATASSATNTTPTALATAPAVTTTTATTATTAATASTATATATATATPPASTDQWPADTRLSYRLSGYYRGDLHGDARVQWQRSGDKYQVRIEVDVSVLVSLSMTSQGMVTPQGLVPHAYEERIRGKRRWATLGEEQVTLENGKQVARPAGVQDTASQFVELAHQFTSGRAVLQPGRQVQFWMARPGAVDLWTYDMSEEVTLQTPNLGPVRAVHLKPRPIANPRGNITAEMWFAPSLQYLPVRIRIEVGDNNFVDLLVDHIEQR